MRKGENSMTEKRRITAEDLLQFTFISDPQIHPDGTSVLFTRTTIEQDSKDYRSHIWRQPLAGGEARMFTSGPKTDTSPRWSPDGKTFAFVSDRSGTRQIWIMPADGGEARQFTDLKNGVSAPVWSPDGEWIAFNSELKPDEEVQSEKDKNKKEEDKKDEVLVVDRMQYKSDDAGFWNGRYNQAFVIPATGGEVKRLTDGEYNVGGLFWSSDSTKLGFVSYRGEHPDQTFLNDIYFVTVEGGDLNKVTDTSLLLSQPQISPNGKTIAFFGQDREFKNATLTRLYTLPVEGGEIRCLTSDIDQYIGDAGMSDMRGFLGAPTMQWSQDGQSILVLSSLHGNVHLYRIGLDGSMTQLSNGNRQVFGFSYHGESEQVVLSLTDSLIPNDLYLLDLNGSKEQRLTAVNEEFLSGIHLSEPEEFWYEGVNGWKVQGWIMKPIGFKEGTKYPMALEIHGGPAAMYSNSFFQEMQLLAAEGYVVVYTNPRGGHGYGQTFVDAVRGDYGGNDYGDLMKGVDYVTATYPYIDEDRMVVTGGSYGGFMTNWILGQTNRFKAAVTQRSISNWISFYGVSDIGYYFTEWQILGNAWDDVEKLWHHSPLKYVTNIETPLLILHSEHDYRCPIEQAEQLFIALKRLGKADTQFVRFPNANHNLSRNGKPKLRIERLNRIVGWFNKYVERPEGDYQL
jgi:dipeptidyl aminopeptidase/acylaminoacyl peptidase